MGIDMEEREKEVFRHSCSGDRKGEWWQGWVPLSEDPAGFTLAGTRFPSLEQGLGGSALPRTTAEHQTRGAV